MLTASRSAAGLSLASRAPALAEETKTRIRRTHDLEQPDRMQDAYAEEYAGTGMSFDAVLEELLADAYAGIPFLFYPGRGGLMTRDKR